MGLLFRHKLSSPSDKSLSFFIIIAHLGHLGEVAFNALKEAEKEKHYKGHYEMFDDHASETTEMA
jgi:hypothetical protein